jgi:hypothetical protein
MCRFSRTSVAIMLAFVTVFYPLLAPRPHRINRDQFGSVKRGMSRAEVDAIFGAPPGSYDWAEPVAWFSLNEHRDVFVTLHRPAPPQTAMPWLIHELDGRVRILETWSGRHGFFTISFSAEDRVVFRGSGKTRLFEPWWYGWRWWRRLTA